MSNAKVISAGVIGKALLMGTAVTLLAASVPFWQSILLVLISACATGIFGILIVYIQARSESQMHYRLEKLEEKGTSIENKADQIVEKTDTIQSAVTPEVP